MDDVITGVVGNFSTQSTPGKLELQIAEPVALPFTFYGTVTNSPGFTAKPNMAVTAWIEGREKPCGKAATRLIASQIVFTINVLADSDGGYEGCGVPNAQVTFKIDDKDVDKTIILEQNGQLTRISL